MGAFRRLIRKCIIVLAIRKKKRCSRIHLKTFQFLLPTEVNAPKAMAETEHLLADVHPRKPDWNLNVYIIRLWEVPSKYNPNEFLYLEMILQDSKGERLHAVVPDWLINRWKNVLKEFTMFNMKWFLVAEDKLKSRTTETDMFLLFFNRTEVTTVVNPPFPLEALRLKPINEILQAQRIDSAELFCGCSVKSSFTFRKLFQGNGCSRNDVLFPDVVALVVGKEDPREMLSKTGKELKRLAIVIEDTE
ncbi:hypothetical protein PIB30_051279 [Stylosanthes scabra]|uniref:Replication protein A 70 kDa DNA-binding subunit B/D first OB fold domain-containing protein n=1 Tax=Stylosanthes scabra TaxID=79078 RepID=A0ABU6UI75_9FABA|nr:hypothetical protein [Stylosanthes scabra]